VAAAAEGGGGWHYFGFAVYPPGSLERLRRGEFVLDRDFCLVLASTDKRLLDEVLASLKEFLQGLVPAFAPARTVHVDLDEVASEVAAALRLGDPLEAVEKLLRALITNGLAFGGLDALYGVGTPEGGPAIHFLAITTAEAARRWRELGLDRFSAAVRSVLNDRDGVLFRVRPRVGGGQPSGSSAQ
jgi:hypothetical protein